jgi:hypothetical protein
MGVDLVAKRMELLHEILSLSSRILGFMPGCGGGAGGRGGRGSGGLGLGFEG